LKNWLSDGQLSDEIEERIKYPLFCVVMSLTHTVLITAIN